MRILIIGEYSAFARNLSSGLKNLDHTVLVFSWGDGFKEIKQDEGSVNINVSNYRCLGVQIKKSYKIRSLFASLNLQRVVKKLSAQEKWDIVLVINPAFLRKEHQIWKPLFSKSMIISLIQDPSNIFLSACGNDVVYDSYMPMLGRKGKEQKRFTPDVKRNELKLYNDYKTYISKVIPVIYSYAEAYRRSLYGKCFHLLPTIPLPIDISRIDFGNEISDRIVIFHGINRPIKGTKIIMKAMGMLKAKYPNKVEVIAKGKMPLSEYLALMKRTNIVVDQCNSISYGMNALYAMAMGKVVLSGNEPVNLKEFNVDYIPVVNICPNEKQIFQELERLILDRNLIVQLGHESRKYVEKNHDCMIIAERYLEQFSVYVNTQVSVSK